jgi:hypothetical protein
MKNGLIFESEITNYRFELLIKESENFNNLFSESIIINEGLSLNSIKESIVNFIKKIIKLIKDIKEFIKKSFSNIFIKKSIEKADKLEKDIKEVENNSNSNDDNNDIIKKKVSKLSKEFRKILYSDGYVFVSTKQFFEENNIRNIENKFDEYEKLYEDIMKDNKYSFNTDDKVTKLREDSDPTFNNFLLCTFNLNKNKSIIYEDKLNVTECIDLSRNIIKENINDNKNWEKYHFVSGGYPSWSNYPALYKKYCNYQNENSKKYIDILDKLNKITDDFRAIIFKVYNYDIDKTDKRQYTGRTGGAILNIYDDDDINFSNSEENNLYRSKIFANIRYVLKLLSYVEFDIKYINLLTETNLKGIKASSILLGKVEALCGAEYFK